MSTQTWSTTTRLLLVLGVGILLVLAWQGGRMSATGALPFGMMTTEHGDGVRGHGHMQGRTQPTAEGDFEGETGLQRCRAMMGTMAGMHQSMRSMMGMGTSADTSATPAHRGLMGGRMGMMHGSMGSTNGEGAGDSRMDAEQMRRLCRTMHGSMRAAMHGEATVSGDADDGAFEGTGLSEEIRRWLQSARGAESIVDRTGVDEVVVEVGAGDGFRYAPAAVRVDPGTTVRWRWTGQGGLHDVAFLNADVSTSLRDEAGAEFRHTFDAPGAYMYECTPHTGVGMKGAVIVAENQ